MNYIMLDGLSIDGFDKDSELCLEMEHYGETVSIYLKREQAIKLRDWLTKQLRRKRTVP